MVLLALAFGVGMCVIPVAQVLIGEISTLREVLGDGKRALVVGHADEERVVWLAEPLLGEVDGEDGPEVVGIAIWFLSFSTWTGTNGIWLEDLFVDPAHRGRGLGQGLLRALAGECVERGFQRLEWWVLDWNTPSIEFYRSLGSTPQDGWTVHRVDGAALSALAAP